MQCFYRIYIMSSLNGEVEYGRSATLINKSGELHYGECTPGEYYKIIIANNVNELFETFNRALMHHYDEMIVNNRNYNSVVNYKAPKMLECFVQIKPIPQQDLTVSDLQKLKVSEFKQFLKDSTTSSEEVDAYLKILHANL